MSKKTKVKKKMNENDISFYRVQGSAFAFIEFLNLSNDDEQIHHMWRWLKNEFYEKDIEDRMIFPFFKNAREWGYDIPLLTSKLIGAILKYQEDQEDDEAGWLACIFGSPEFNEGFDK